MFYQRWVSAESGDLPHTFGLWITAALGCRVQNAEGKLTPAPLALETLRSGDILQLAPPTDGVDQRRLWR